MRRPLIAGNWKMNTNRAEAVALAEDLVAKVDAGAKFEMLVCPPYAYLEAVGGVVRNSPIALGAQNMYHKPQGAFTGEISGPMLRDLGCQWVVLGHSERRHVLGESDADVNLKVKAALDHELTPILCVGETLQQRKAGKTLAVIRSQFAGSLDGLAAEQINRCVLAYEPVWAIGTGETATPEQAEEVHADLRSILADRYNAEIAASVRILYGGSVKPRNAADLLKQENIDGALVGGASLKAEDFLAIAVAA